jgi:hypothetical protein
VALALALGSAATILIARRREGRGPRRVDLYFADGSLLTLAAGDDAAAMLADAGRALAALEPA